MCWHAMGVHIDTAHRAWQLIDRHTHDVGTVKV